MVYNQKAVYKFYIIVKNDNFIIGVPEKDCRRTNMLVSYTNNVPGFACPALLTGCILVYIQSAAL